MVGGSRENLNRCLRTGKNADWSICGTAGSKRAGGGYATVGVVGSDIRYEYTAFGTTVNVAARLCDEAHDGEILLSPRAFFAVEGAFEISAKGEIFLKGIHDPVEVFSV